MKRARLVMPFSVLETLLRLPAGVEIQRVREGPGTRAVLIETTGDDVNDQATAFGCRPVTWTVSAPERFTATFDRRLDLPPGMGTRLLHPEWDAQTTAAYWHFWPMSEAWG